MNFKMFLDSIMLPPLPKSHLICTDRTSFFFTVPTNGIEDSRNPHGVREGSFTQLEIARCLLFSHSLHLHGHAAGRMIHVIHLPEPPFLTPSAIHCHVKVLAKWFCRLGALIL